MFIGEYEHSVDAKGRVIMPAKLREDIGEKFILTKGLDGCLFAYSQTEWTNFEEKLKTLPLTNLREYGKLDKEIVILGVGTRIEIWDKTAWKKDEESISADEIAENMDMYLGI